MSTRSAMPSRRFAAVLVVAGLVGGCAGLGPSARSLPMFDHGAPAASVERSPEASTTTDTRRNVPEPAIEDSPIVVTVTVLPPPRPGAAKEKDIAPPPPEAVAFAEALPSVRQRGEFLRLVMNYRRERRIRTADA